MRRWGAVTDVKLKRSCMVDAGEETLIELSDGDDVCGYFRQPIKAPPSTGPQNLCRLVVHHTSSLLHLLVLPHSHPSATRSLQGAANSTWHRSGHQLLRGCCGARPRAERLSPQAADSRVPSRRRRRRRWRGCHTLRGYRTSRTTRHISTRPPRRRLLPNSESPWYM